jgi:hypothetical protein
LGHQEAHGRKRAAAFRATDKGFHRAVFGGDVQGFFDHGIILGAGQRAAIKLSSDRSDNAS